MMLRATLSAASAAAVFAIMLVATPSQAVADAPCARPPCGVRPVVVHRAYVVPRYYIVDRGPVYVGPGIFANPTVVWRQKLPRYPYVGRVWPGF
jgi:hypothetical protein